MEEAWKTYYEGYESLTTDDIVNALDYAIETPRHVNVGMLELMPTFQVPGGLTFDRRGDSDYSRLRDAQTRATTFPPSNR